LLALSGVSFAGEAPDSPAPAGGNTAAAPTHPDEEQALAAAVEEMTDIRDIKPPEIYGSAVPWGLLAVVSGVLGAALVLFALWRRRRRSRTLAAGPPPPPPDETALAALAALGAQTGLSDKALYFELSAILRAYLDGRFHLDTAERTTEELLPVIRDLPAGTELRSALADLFRFADPIKYADRLAGESRRAADLGFADTFVRATRPVTETADV
jgi:hypothetical protein